MDFIDNEIFQSGAHALAKGPTCIRPNEVPYHIAPEQNHPLDQDECKPAGDTIHGPYSK